MKTLTKILFVASMITIFTSCKSENHSTCIGYVPPVFNLNNRSGHTISVVLKPSSMQVPDSLVIQKDENYVFSYETSKYGKLDFFVTVEFDTRSIYYDGRYKLNIADLPNSRQFQNRTIYQKEPDTYNPYIFTFTTEDYDYAVKNGQDLGENLP